MSLPYYHDICMHAHVCAVCGLMQDGGAATSAPVCSSWVFVNQSIAKRRMTRPLGDEMVPSVYCANVMVTRVLLIQFIFLARGIYTVLEQPMGSLMQYHPLFQRFLAKTTCYRHSLRMKDYHLPADKATWLYCSHKFVNEVDELKSTMLCEEVAEMTVSRYNAEGKVVIDGGKDLKKSQAYTRAFAWSMCLVWRRHREELEADAAAVRRRARSDARLSGVRVPSRREILQDPEDMQWFTKGCLAQAQLLLTSHTVFVFTRACRRYRNAHARVSIYALVHDEVFEYLGDCIEANVEVPKRTPAAAELEDSGTGHLAKRLRN